MSNFRIEQLLKLLEQAPGDNFVLFALAKEYHNAGSLNEAKEYYNTLLVQNPGYIGAYYHYASLLVEQNNLIEAMEMYNKGIETAKNAKDLHALSELKNARKNLELEL